MNESTFKEASEATSKITNFANSFSFTDKSEAFNKAMSHEHRTLQQAFTKLCFAWIEYVASPEYATDARNEQSKEVSKTILSLFEQKQKDLGFDENSLKFMGKPSKHLGCI